MSLHEETEINRSFESFSGLIGRDEDKERIINLLAEPFKVGDEHPLVLPIVGMGGLGKTSLAKSVCDDEIVNTHHFDLKMEACVSDDFSLKQVIQKIIESATGKRCADLNEGELIQELEDAQKWLLLKPLLSKGADGSKIIVTTRSQRVAEIMGTVAEYKLSFLGKDDCLSLFYKCAFKEGQKELYPNLVGIGEEIVEKCKQVPLAVINMGTQLYDYPFADLFLVQFWIAHGLILQSSNPNENLEEVGLRYVRELISRCFFQDYEDEMFAASFKMHDLMHDLASSLTQNEFSIISYQNHQFSKTTRHLSVLDS
uniref:Uncharacterized protein n=1 Tax=Populus trichocarpa TaxID=3694 RepID=A0A2K1X7X1_POPTR